MSNIQRVLNYRGDLLKEEDFFSLKKFESILKKNEIVDEEALEELLKSCGGFIYPQGTLAEYTELIVVSLILACGIRGFIAQPFKIPTNSMYPTYNGVVTNVCEQPVKPLKWINKILLGNTYYQINNNSSFGGEISIKLSDNGKRIEPVYENSNGNVYEFFIGDNLLKLEIPKEASLENLLVDTFFYQDALLKNPREILLEKISKPTILSNGSYVISLGKNISPGETIFSFALKTGDMVLVDRIYYNFFKPSVGDPFVFKTGNIPGLKYQKLYYIKRLAGVPGDKIKIENGQFFNNGQLPEGIAFDANNLKQTENDYFGYLQECGSPLTPYSWPLNKEMIVPENYYYALGDNSWNSYDSRGWGGVPVADTIGPARLIIYPISNHWGIAK